MTETEIDTDYLDTITAAARWSKIAGLVASSGMQVLFDEYEIKQGRDDLDFRLTVFKHDIECLHELYVFIADEAKRKELRGIFRRMLAYPSAKEEPFAQIVWPLKQIVEEYDFLAKHNCHPPDGEMDA